MFTHFCFFFQYPQNEEIECLSWTQPKERWCHVAKWHNGSRECVCNGLSSYVLNLTATHSELKIPKKIHQFCRTKTHFLPFPKKWQKNQFYIQLKRRFKFFDWNRTLFLYVLDHSATGRDVLMDLKDEAAAIDGRGYSSHFGKEATSAEATMTSTMIVIVAVSATFLVISVLSAGLLVVYCRRVKVCI